MRFFVIVILTLLYTPLYAQPSELPREKKKVVLGVVEFPPLVIKNIDSPGCHGDAVTISRTILELVGYKVEVECPPPARLFERIRKGQVDITMNVKGTKALENTVTFIEKPFSYLSIVLMTNSKVENNKTVAAIRGYDYVGLRQELENNGYTFFDMANSSDAFQLFQFGRTSHLATYEAPYLYHIKRNSNNVDDLIVSMRKDIPTFLAISNASAKKEELESKLSKLLALSDSQTVIEQVQTQNNKNQ